MKLFSNATIVVLLLLVGFGTGKIVATAVCDKEQGCDINKTVYENHSGSTVTVSLEFTDGFPDAESYVEVYGKSGPTPGPVIAKGTVPDMTTMAFTFDVPPTGIVRFNCRGKGPGNGSVGACSWRLISAAPK
jgi:hypothetical protein